MTQDDISELPRISESCWKDINRLAEGIDASLRAGNSKLAMSCQLSFFAVKESNEPEWTNEVNGPTKKRYARALIRRFKTRLAKKGIIKNTKNKKHSKHTPLWTLSLYWRLDNKPLVFENPEDEKASSSVHPSEDLNPSLQVLSITPGSGCLNAHLPMTQNWRQTSAMTSCLYKQANECGLSAEKVAKGDVLPNALDNCPIVIGGSSYKESPFITKPDLLASLITYWQNHPSLSYFFSTPVIGPHSSNARLDEIRYDGLYELEMALDKIPILESDAVRPEQLDEFLAHLLVSSNGQPETAEICIDRLHPRDYPERQKGYVELRSLAMAADEHMSLLQGLLIRAIILRLKANSFRKPFIRWGNKLQNEFMLPYFLYQDFVKVLKDLRYYGYAFNENWFAPHFLRRFPKYGKVVLDDVELELSQALEPMNAPNISSQEHLHHPNVERLQLRVKALNPERHIVTCNDITLPLSEIDKTGVQIAAIRMKSKSHPDNVGASTKSNNDLTVELVDRKNQTSLGGFFYNISQSTPVLPEDADETGSTNYQLRRQAFMPFAPYTGRVSVRPQPENLDYPNMLDLRRM